MFIPQVDGLVTWATSHGAHVHEKVEIYEDNQYGISLRVRGTGSSDLPGSAEDQAQPANTRRGLPQNSLVVSCPFVLSLSYLNSLDVIPDLKAHSPRFPESFFRSIEPQVIGYFFLMQQYLMGEESYWRPYIRSLPQPHEHDKHPNLLYFTVADMQWLRGTNLERARSERESTWRLDWEKGRDILDSHPEWEFRKGQWSWELYKWAATIFSSRSFVSNLIPGEIFKGLTDDSSSEQETCTPHGLQYEFPDTQSRLSRCVPELFWQEQVPGANRHRKNPLPVLFPLIDLANHSSSARVTWFTNAHSIPRDLSIILEADIPEGDQIFNNYGPKSNTELLLGYGFCIPGNDEVAIAFKPPGEDIMSLLKLHSCHQKPNTIEGGQKVFHIRRSPYPRPPIDKRLPEFAVFEDGCVDILAVCVANQREKEFMAENPRYCPEKDAEASFSGSLLRNILNVMSVLYEKAQMALNEVIKYPDDGLGIPRSATQHAAKIYRQGQISVLQNVVETLEQRLDAAISVHSICKNMDCSPKVPVIYHDMRMNVELVPLQCVFSWLQTEKYDIWLEITVAINRELDPENVSLAPYWRWHELIAGEWDNALWCLWIYVVTIHHVIDSNQAITNNYLTEWIDIMLTIYNPDGRFSAWPFQTFHGEVDERETLEVIVGETSQKGILFELFRRNNARVQEMGGLEVVNRKFMNFASAVAREECFMVSVALQHHYQKAPMQKRINQRVLCLAKKRETAKHSSLSRKHAAVYPTAAISTSDPCRMSPLPEGDENELSQVKRVKTSRNL